MEEKRTINVATRRWLVRELECGRMSMEEVLQRMEVCSKNPYSLLAYWRKRYAPEIPLTLPLMTEKDKQKLDAANKRLKELEKELEKAQMKNIALDTMIDLAEEQFKINIRKKSGPKQ